MMQDSMEIGPGSPAVVTRLQAKKFLATSPKKLDMNFESTRNHQKPTQDSHVQKEESLSSESLPAGPDKQFWTFVDMLSFKFILYILFLHLFGSCMAVAPNWTSLDLPLFLSTQVTLWGIYSLTTFVSAHGFPVKELFTFSPQKKVKFESYDLSPEQKFTSGKWLLLGTSLSGIASAWLWLSKTVPTDFWDTFTVDPFQFIPNIPWTWAVLGIVVACVAIYLLSEFKGPLFGLGEFAKSFMLSILVPTLGQLEQAGTLSWDFYYSMIPLFLLNVCNQLVSNIPRRMVDIRNGRGTSVVLLGEFRTLNLRSVIIVLTFFYIIPTLPIIRTIKLAYFLVSPLIWLQSLQLSDSGWWNNSKLASKILRNELVCLIATCFSLLICQVIDQSV